MDGAIGQKKAELDRLRPLSPLDALDRWYDVELTYSSNALEGNTLTRSETAIVLERGLTVSGKPLKDHLEPRITATLSATFAGWPPKRNQSGRSTSAIFTGWCSCEACPKKRANTANISG